MMLTCTHVDIQALQMHLWKSHLDFSCSLFASLENYLLPIQNLHVIFIVVVEGMQPGYQGLTRKNIMERKVCKLGMVRVYKH